jgi:hypothetical protein
MKSFTISNENRRTRNFEYRSRAALCGRLSQAGKEAGFCGWKFLVRYSIFRLKIKTIAAVSGSERHG